MNLVMDSSALLALLRGELGADAVSELLVAANDRVYLHAINACEVYCDIMREQGRERAAEALSDLQGLGIEIIEDMDRGLWEEAGCLKANLKRISLADCFCAILAIRLGAEVVTADHHEFDRIVEAGICSVRFIR